MSLSQEQKRGVFESGTVKEVKQFLKETPTWDVNEVLDRYGYTALHLACLYGRHESVSVLLTHPQINVNHVNMYGSTPFRFGCGCYNGNVEVVNVLLRDSRVDINLPANDGCTPLWIASRWGRVEAIRWIIASGREIDLDTKGVIWDGIQYTAIEIAREMNKTAVVSLLERFTRDQAQTRHEICVELGLVDAFSAELFAATVFLCDDYLRIRGAESKSEVARFFRIASRLPMELQMMICHRVYGSAKENIPSKNSEPAFKNLAKTCV